ncbi:MAG: hypothetical protein [Bacteriophage sp.]|nr:MAG: hypothetical protein [Bacteriophage sp.]
MSEKIVTVADVSRWVEEGYTLWHGGEQPVPTGTLVDVVFRDVTLADGVRAGEVNRNGRSAQRWEYHRGGQRDDDIVAWRLAVPPEKKWAYAKGNAASFNLLPDEITRIYRDEISGLTSYAREIDAPKYEVPNSKLIAHRVKAQADSPVTGVKHDSDKPRFSLLPLKQVWDIVAVLEFGAKKYAPGNWQKVPDAKNRYFDAAMRHLCAWRSGEKRDPETNLPHLAHAACCLLFLMWGDDQK